MFIFEILYMFGMKIYVILEGGDMMKNIVMIGKN